MPLTTITSGMLPADIISDHTNIGAQPADTDEVLLSDAGVLKAVTVSNLIAGAGGGLERVSIFRLTTSFTGAAASGITSNWEEADTYGYGKGDAAAAVTESSGVFTFAATGVYLVYWHVEAYGATDHGTTYGNIRVTTDSGSNYYDSAYGNASINVVGSANTHQGTNAFQIVDVTSTSVVKCLMTAATHSSNTIYGTTNQNTTYCMFLQLNST